MGSAASMLTARQLGLGLLHVLDGLGQQLGDLRRTSGSCSTSWLFMRVSMPSDLLAQPRLRQRHHGGALLQLVGRDVLAIALHVEGRRDDLALLLGQRLDLPAATAAAPATAALRLRLAEVLLERPDAHEVEVARRALGGAAAAVVVHARARSTTPSRPPARPALRGRTCARRSPRAGASCPGRASPPSRRRRSPSRRARGRGRRSRPPPWPRRTPLRPPTPWCRARGARTTPWARRRPARRWCTAASRPRARRSAPPARTM